MTPVGAWVTLLPIIKTPDEASPDRKTRTLKPKLWVHKVVYRASVGMMEKKMETTIWVLGFRV